MAEKNTAANAENHWFGNIQTFIAKQRGCNSRLAMRGRAMDISPAIG
jgi:hypothetical protein